MGNGNQQFEAPGYLFETLQAGANVSACSNDHLLGLALAITDYTYPLDLIAGTSTGGILALGLTLQNPDEPEKPKFRAKEIINLYE